MKQIFTSIMVLAIAGGIANAGEWPGLTGAGTAEDPYQISSASDFYILANNISAENTGAGEYFIVTQDIDFGGSQNNEVQLPAIGKDGITNIANVAWGFEGNFDGQGYAIKGIYHTKHELDKAGQFNALFSSVGKNGVIKNIVFAKENYIWSYNYVAPIASVSQGSIINCENYSDVKAENAFAAGICGALIQGNGKISECSNYGNIEAMTYACGILACCQSGTIVTEYNYLVSECSNYGELWTNNYTGAAGIAGSFSGTISNCVNYGIVGGNDDYISAKQYNAGIVSCASFYLSVENCVNNAIIYGYNYTAGIVGNIQTSDDSEVLITNCINNGSVIAQGVNIAGIVGNSKRSQDKVVVSYCANNAEISTTEEGEDIIGNIRGSALIALGEGNTIATGLTIYSLDEGVEIEGEPSDAGVTGINIYDNGIKDGKYLIEGHVVVIRQGKAYRLDGSIIK